MAYTPNTWATDDTITADKLNNIEQGIANEQVGPAGAKGDTGAAGKAGLGIKSIAFTTDADGKVTGGTATMTDDSTQAITVTVTPAS